VDLRFAQDRFLTVFGTGEGGPIDFSPQELSVGATLRVALHQLGKIQAIDYSPLEKSGVISSTSPLEGGFILSVHLLFPVGGHRSGCKAAQRSGEKRLTRH
jgi:hypothetical protein